MARSAKRLPPPTSDDRERARVAAAALRAAVADPSTMGQRSTIHVDLARPRRGEWWDTWSGLPGLVRVNCQSYRHASLPGWEYTRAEIRTEMIPDLEALAERGERPWVDATPGQSWREVIGLQDGKPVTAERIREAHRRLAVERQPDKPGGSAAAMTALNRARDAALKEIG